LIVTRVSDGVPVSVIVFKLNLIVVKLMQEEVLFYLLQSYHAATGVVLCLGFRVFNATFNNISVISWQ